MFLKDTYTSKLGLCHSAMRSKILVIVEVAQNSDPFAQGGSGQDVNCSSTRKERPIHDVDIRIVKYPLQVLKEPS
jgi:hypothetical protein